MKLTGAQMAEAAVKRSIASQTKLPTSSLINSSTPVQLSDPAQAWLATLLDPLQSQSRIPDAWADETSLVISTQLVEIPVWLRANDENSGRFSVLVQPTIGHVTAPSQYAVAVVDAENGWPNDFSLATSYVWTIGGNDLRIDRNSRIMTQPQPGIIKLLNTNFAGGGTSPFGASPVMDTFTDVNGVITPTSYGLGYTYTNVPTFAASRFGLPVGSYRITIYLVGAAPVITVAVSAGSLVTPLSLLNYTNGVVNDYSVNIERTAAGSSGYVQFSCVLTSLTYASIAINPIFLPGTDPTLNGGMVKKLRPVATSALLTFYGPLIDNGGMIAANRLAAGSANADYFTQQATTEVNSLQYWEAVGATKNSYTGPLKDGAWSFYAPGNSVDNDFLTPEDHTAHEFPTIVFSGVYTPGQAVQDPTSKPVLRLVVWRVFEVITENRLLSTASCVGKQEYVDEVLAALHTIPRALANESHVRFIDRVRKLFSRARATYDKNKDWIDPAVRGFAALIPTLL